MASKISIYQTLPRLFGNTCADGVFNGTIQQNGCGKFDDYTPQALAEIRQLGITHIWYTGIIQHGCMTDYSSHGIPTDHPTLLKGRAGSPYAIKDYYDVDPDLAVDVKHRMAEFEALVQRTHQAGMKVILDFVPNHLFRQYSSDSRPQGISDFGSGDDPAKAFDRDNNFYYLPNTQFQLPDNIEWLGHIKDELPAKPYTERPTKATGNDKFEAKPDKNDWYETIKLNYGIDFHNGRSYHFDPIPDTWHKMLEVLTFWAGKQVDAFRCDMTEMVPVEFWHWAIQKVKEQFPDLIFIAEIYNPLQYYNYVNFGGFDYLYDKVGLYDTLKNIICHQASTSGLSNCWQILDGLDAQMLRFLENHDEVRLASTAFAGRADAAIPAMLVAACMHQGPIMIYNGQEVGEPARGASGFSGDDGRTSIYDYCAMPEHLKWMNTAKFDGGRLSAAQQDLQNYYQKLLSFSIASEAISQGAFYDLMYANPYDVMPCRDKVYAWLRHSKNQKLLLIVHFDANSTNNFHLRIPEHAFGEMQWMKKESITIREVLPDGEAMKFEKSVLINHGLNLSMEGFSSRIFEME